MPKFKFPQEKLNAYFPEPIEIDLGCGPWKIPGSIGIDIMDIPEVDIVMDLSKGIPFSDSSVSLMHMAHFLEHISWPLDQFLLEIYRVIKPDGKIVLRTPYLHSWDAFCPGHSLYLSEEWFKNNAMVNKYFEIIRFDYTYTPLMDLVTSKIKISKDEARQLFWNVCKEFIMEWKPKK